MTMTGRCRSALALHSSTKWISLRYKAKRGIAMPVKIDFRSVGRFYGFEASRLNQVRGIEMFKYLFAKNEDIPAGFRRGLFRVLGHRLVCHRYRPRGVQRRQAGLPGFCPWPGVRLVRPHAPGARARRHLRLDLHGLRHGHDVHDAGAGKHQAVVGEARPVELLPLEHRPVAGTDGAVGRA